MSDNPRSDRPRTIAELVEAQVEEAHDAIPELPATQPEVTCTSDEYGVTVTLFLPYTDLFTTAPPPDDSPLDHHPV